MKLYAILDGRTVHAWEVKPGEHLVGSSRAVEYILDPRFCPDVLCKVSADSGPRPGAESQDTQPRFRIFEMGMAPLTTSSGKTFQGVLYNGDWVMVGLYKLLALDSLELPQFLVGPPLGQAMPTAASDGIEAPRKQPLALVVQGDKGSKVVPARDGLTIGRDARCVIEGIQLLSPAVSKKHAALVEELNGFSLMDLGSAHGTFLNGVRLTKGERYPLEDEMIIQITRLPKIPRIVVRSMAKLLESPPADDADAAIVGDSGAMLGVRQKIARFAANPTLIVGFVGETGCGKELAALAFAAHAGKKLVMVDCARLQPNTFSAELYGSVSGAFTGAVTREGLVQQADGGILHLDEVGEASEEMQKGLLRLIQEHTVRPEGSTKTSKVDIRVTWATHRNLEERVEQGLFRRDLFYRLKEAIVELPPLRQRMEDLAPLAQHILGGREGAPPRTLSADALAALHAHDWPGNVRELVHLLETAAALSETEEIAASIVRTLLAKPTKAADFVPKPAGVQTREDIEAVEKQLISETLARCHGKVKAAAKILHYPPTTLRARAIKYGLWREDDTPEGEE
jgi:DNA-binding NtrC family response regulator